MRTRIIISLLAWIAAVASLMAQPSQFLLGAFVADGHLDIYDLHFLRHDPDTGQDEFLAVVGNHEVRRSLLGHIYFVHFAYGGTPANMTILNVRSFKPIAEGVNTSAPRFARLIYQPPIRGDDPLT